MELINAFAAAWRKNAPELFGLWNESLPKFVLARRPSARCGGVPVFTYHIVEAGELEADLEFLATNGYRTLRAAELLDYLAGTWDPQCPIVMLTFDDGPRNLFEVVFPLLERYAAHAVAFVAPGLHADDVEDDATEARPLSWREITAIHTSGRMEFHSHTLESRFVPRWPAAAPLAGCDPEIERARRGLPRPLAEDLALSRVTIEHRLPNARVDQLAFPLYLGTEAAVEVARAAGFRACHWGLIPGRPVNRPGDSPFFVSRLSDEFLRRLPGTGRITLRQLFSKRLHRIQSARAWRRRFTHPQRRTS
jgi:peptidoglycan/xylan/chitin deacetylase (PgdA/CDA1 family)